MMDWSTKKLARRKFLQSAGAMGLLAGLERIAPAYAWAGAAGAAARAPLQGGDVIDLAIRAQSINIGGREATATLINGSLPGPLLRLREGETVTLRVKNQLEEDASLHWHGILLPEPMDGVPGVSFAGIKPGETFTYRYPVRQSGTYWYHSHSGFQEQTGVSGPIIIDAAEPEPFRHDRDYVVMLSDWTFEDPHRVLSKLKKQADYYNFQKLTAGDFFREVSQRGWQAALSDRLAWSKMRMSPTDISDVTGSTYTYLTNGLAPESNWTGLFKPGERVRLRFINGSAMTYFDIRIPGLKMTVVQADGQNVQPVPVDEFRIAVAETYDVIVEPEQDGAYTIFAEAMDRSGYARGTLATRAGMSAPIPPRRPRPLRSMADMGMGGMDMSGGAKPAQGMPGMDMTGAAKPTAAMPGMDMSGAAKPAPAMPGMDMSGAAKPAPAMPGMDMSGAAKPAPAMPGMDMKSPDTKGPDMPGMNMPGGPAAASSAGDTSVTHSPGDYGPGNSVVPMSTTSRLNEPGDGLENTGTRVLVYTDLRSVTPFYDQRAPQRQIELHLTGNMDKYMWSFDGKKYSEVKGPIPFRYGERLRLVLVNDTMMDHPIHLHGMWMNLENGAGSHLPRKHTISVKPAERLSVIITADAPGKWAFHCHLLYHMEMGMFRVVEVSGRDEKGNS
jgi:CopA family copper-resistance protein